MPEDDLERNPDEPDPERQSHIDDELAEAWQGRLELFAVALDVAEKLDELVAKLDPDGEPPLHAEATQQRLQNMARKYAP